MKVGDKVYTVKGCRIAGIPGSLMTIVEIGRKWMSYDAVICEKSNGTKRMFLVKNLRPHKPEGK
ncbi:MAG: hypothetical protein V3R78_10255 [Thermodesulfobacteriota bacterium]